MEGRPKKKPSQLLAGCRYQHPGTGVRCGKEVDENRAYCTVHEACAPFETSGTGVGFPGCRSIGRSPRLFE